jgi:hypothetical protein
MADIDLTPILFKKYGSKKRKFARYNASELYSLIHGGWVKPEEYMSEEFNDFASIMRMWSGIGGHEQIQNLFDNENCEIKKEFEFDGFTLVGKCDMLKEDEVWEFKTSEKEMTKAKPWAAHQAKLYCTMFERPRARVLQPLLKGNKVILKELAVVERDDEWFKGEIEKLRLYDQKVKKSYKKES